MSNLIITIISIALVAVVALIGIWYGGGAFSNTSVTAQANTMIAQAEQISNAIRVLSLDNGGIQSYPGAINCTLNGSALGNALISGRYIQSIPGQSFHGDLCGGGPIYTPGRWAYMDGTGSCAGPIKILVTEFGNNSYLQTNCGYPTTDYRPVCNAINKLQGVTTPPNDTSWVTLFSAMGNYNFICEENYSYPGLFYFLYRVF